MSMVSAPSSEVSRGGAGQMRLSCGFWTLSSTTIVVSWSSIGTRTAGLPTSGPRGSGPNHFFTSSSVFTGSTSPPMASVQLLGAYQRRKKSFTSSSDAAVRSSWLPMVSQLYGWSLGYSVFITAPSACA